MIMKILNVKIGAYDENTDKIYNFWIEGQLKSGLSISVFEYLCKLVYDFHVF